MIRVTSANNKTDFFINPRKIQTIKQLGDNLHITLEDEKKFIVTNTIEDINNKIIEFENLIMYWHTFNKNTTKEGYNNE